MSSRALVSAMLASRVAFRPSSRVTDSCRADRAWRWFWTLSRWATSSARLDSIMAMASVSSWRLWFSFSSAFSKPSRAE